MSYGVGTRVGVSAAIAALLSLSSGASGGGGGGVTTYATWNPLDKGSGITLSNGNLTATCPNTTIQFARSTIGLTTGKWYWEIVATTADLTAPMPGIVTASTLTASQYPGQTTDSIGWYPNGNVYVNNSITYTRSSYVSGDVLGFALDKTGQTLSLYKNGVSAGASIPVVGTTHYAAFGQAGASVGVVGVANFGATALTYTPPAGYNAGIYTVSTDVSFVAWDSGNKGSGIALSSNNTVITVNVGTSSAKATKGISSGKWYWETTYTTKNVLIVIGVGTTSENNLGLPGDTTTSFGYRSLNGQKYNNSVGSAYGSTFTTGDVIGTALDMDNGTLIFYKNGVSQGTAYTGLTGILFPFVGSNQNNEIATTNFGATAFTYSIPTGYSRLATLYTAPSNTATWNPADKGANLTLSGGNLSVTSAGYNSVRATLSKSTGKWYWEVLCNLTGNGAVGLATSGLNLNGGIGVTTTSIGWRLPDNAVIYNSTSLGAYGAFVAGDVIGLAIDADAATIKWYKNGVYFGSTSTSISAPLFPAVALDVSAGTFTANFGALPFIYTPPAGYTAGVY